MVCIFSDYIEHEERCLMEHIGRGEWPIPYLDIDGVREVQAEVFRVKNLGNEKIDVNDFLASLIHERRLTPKDLKKKTKKLPERWPGHPDKDSWYQRYMDYLEWPENGPPYLPCPHANSWTFREYYQWVDSLIGNPSALRPIPRDERKYNFGIKVTLVHGDITDHLDWLYVEDASLILRGELLSDCLLKWAWLQTKAVDLQPKWDKNPITKLKWSGQDSTPNLTLELLKLSNSPTAATVVHGNATLKELRKQLRNYSGDVEHLIIFHKDAEDYRD